MRHCCILAGYNIVRKETVITQRAALPLPEQVAQRCCVHVSVPIGVRTAAGNLLSVRHAEDEQTSALQLSQ